jgi:sugar fermentation stimulation protein A
MQFKSTLVRGSLIQRYKRFLADIELEDGSRVTAHCANPGSMKTVAEPGSPVWISAASNPNRKLKWDWQLIEINGALVSVNTALPNAIAEEALSEGLVPELRGYANLKREVKYGENSRIDILLSSEDKPDCYVEIKNVNMMRSKGLAEFPDSVTSRGAKHLRELSTMVEQGHRAVMLFIVQRNDCEKFTVAHDIDPNYQAALTMAVATGVEVLCYTCAISTSDIKVDRSIPIELDSRQ